MGRRSDRDYDTERRPILDDRDDYRRRTKKDLPDWIAEYGGQWTSTFAIIQLLLFGKFLVEVPGGRLAKRTKVVEGEGIFPNTPSIIPPVLDAKARRKLHRRLKYDKIKRDSLQKYSIVRIMAGLSAFLPSVVLIFNLLFLREVKEMIWRCIFGVVLLFAGRTACISCFVVGVYQTMSPDRDPKWLARLCIPVYWGISTPGVYHELSLILLIELASWLGIVLFFYRYNLAAVEAFKEIYNGKKRKKPKKDGTWYIYKFGIKNKMVARYGFVLTISHSIPFAIISAIAIYMGKLDFMLGIVSISIAVVSSALYIFGWLTVKENREEAHEELLKMAVVSPKFVFGVHNAHGIKSCCFSMDTKYFLCGTKGGKFIVWDFIRKKHVVSRMRHGKQVESIAISSKYCATGSHDHLCRIWNVGNYLSRKHMVSKEDQRLYDKYGTGDEWTFVKRCKGHRGWIHHVAFSSDGEFLATASWDMTIRIWPRSFGNFRCGKILGMNHFRDAVTWVGFMRDDSVPYTGYVVVAGDQQGNIGVWEVGTSEDTYELRLFTHVHGLYGVIRGVLAPDGRHAFLGAASGHVCWLQLSRTTDRNIYIERWMESRHAHPVGMVDVCPDCKHAVSAFKNMRLWDLNTGRTVKMVTFAVQVVGGCVSPCGQYVCLGSDINYARVFDLFATENWGNETFVDDDQDYLKEPAVLEKLTKEEIEEKVRIAKEKKEQRKEDKDKKKRKNNSGRRDYGRNDRNHYSRGHDDDDHEERRTRSRRYRDRDRYRDRGRRERSSDDHRSRRRDRGGYHRGYRERSLSEDSSYR